MNISEIKQELAKKFGNMNHAQYESFKHDLDVMYSHKHSKNMSWVKLTSSKDEESEEA